MIGYREGSNNQWLKGFSALGYRTVTVGYRNLGRRCGIYVAGVLRFWLPGYLVWLLTLYGNQPLPPCRGEMVTGYEKNVVILLRF